MSLSVVIPVYNEQDIIEVVVKSVYNNIISRVDDSELIIVNDCSTDNTLKILQKLAKRLKKIRIITPFKNGGQGKAIRLGFLNAKKEWVFQIDSDNQFNPLEYWKLDKFRGDYDYIYGYRMKRNDPPHRKMLTAMLRLTNLVLFGTFIKDSNSAFKLIKNSALRQILRILPEDAFAPTILITLLAKKLKYRIKLVGVSHRERKTGKVSIQGMKLAKVCLRGARDMLKFRIKTLVLPENEFRIAQQIKAKRISI